MKAFASLDAPEMDEVDGRVFARTRRRGDVLVILHVEADPRLRGTGAAGRFMEALALQARAEGLKLEPQCSYAAAWLARRRDAFGDLLA
jgi:predicted GNAT family acetyltransferase